MTAYKGLFKPFNPHKYKGNSSRIIYRSSWELKLMSYLDKHPDIIWWQSEEIFVPYLSPKDGKPHRYFPDFIVRKKNKDAEETLMIEIKPFTQTQPPKQPKRQTQQYLYEAITYATNQAKWKAAESYCKDRNWKFVILTEKELNIK